MELHKFLADKDMYIRCILNEIASRNCRLWYVIEIETGKNVSPKNFTSDIQVRSMKFASTFIRLE